MQDTLTTHAPGTHQDLTTGLATQLLDQALTAGATDAEVMLYEGDEFEALVRKGEVERLKESGSRAAGLRVFIGARAASTSTSDLTPAGLERLVQGAVALARVTSEDPFAGLPDAESFGQLRNDLQIYWNDIDELPAAERISLARRADEACFAADARITNSRGGSFDAGSGHKILANSRGFVGEYRRSICSVSASPIAQSPDGQMQRDYWYSSARSARSLESPESIGAEAARRTLRRLGARSVPTQQVPVVFAPEIARSIVGHIFEAANGSLIYHQASFFTGKLGEQVASKDLTIIDDGTMVGRFGTAPFDGEGLPTRRTVIIERGVLKNYLLNTYTARKLGMESTGNASRGITGAPGIGAGNLFLESTAVQSPEAILADVPSGLYVTELIGQGVNMVTGDYSRGASGLWIENGELTYPVEGITIAGNLRDMFQHITAVGDDLVFRSSVASPTLRIDGLTIAGR
ncbi:MAG: PmbA protein [Acidobacteriaceae bacterium]|nr:PmbA protein [Acidobacteriaceae bacterium]